MDSPPAPAPSDPASLRGLVVQTGRAAGTCHPLRSPVTLLGRASACDVRVEAQAVRSLHCLLTPGPDGVALRALHPNDTRVNGQPATSAVLRDGDLIEVGPSRFRLHWPPPDGNDPPAVQALRVQVAAVAAQQAALDEQECRLLERESALTRQEEQLAGHLEAKRKQLLDLQDQITEARAVLRQKRATHAAQAEEQTRELEQAKREAAELRGRAATERKRLESLYRRLRRRWVRQRVAERDLLRRHEDELIGGREQLDADRAAFAETTLRFHGAAEVGKRNLREERTALHAARREWQAQVKAERAAAEEQVRALARRAKEVAAAERRLAEEQRSAERRCHDLTREGDDLETRVGNARRKLQEAERGVPASSGRGEATPPLPEFACALLPVSAGPDLDERKATLERRAAVLARVARELSDQRLHLAEQAERLVQAREGWDADRSVAVTELEELGERQREQEYELEARAEDVRQAGARLEEERAKLARARARLEAEQSRGRALAAVERAGQEKVRVELTAREQAVARREQSAADLYRRWGRRRAHDLDRLRVAIESCRRERDEWSGLREAWLQTQARLQQEQQAVAAQGLALEQYKRECVGASERPAAAKRIERLRRTWVAHCAAAARELDRLRLAIEADAARLDDEGRKRRQEWERLEARAAELSDRAAAAERLALEAGAEQARRDAETTTCREQGERSAQAVAALRAELEQLARLLIEAEPAVAVGRAA